MPHAVNHHLRAADFRQHPAMEDAGVHWLLGAVYGRHLLKTKLRLMRPDLAVRMMRHQPAYENLLESMIDVLGLRDWPKPTTWAERLTAVRLILHMAFELSEGREPPSWRST